MEAEVHSSASETLDEISVQVRLTHGPIIAPAPLMSATRRASQAGAVLSFEGRVRGTERDTGTEELRHIIGLEYQIYEPMTLQELERLAHQYAQRCGVLAADVEHSFGFIGNGECSFLLQVAAAHRREAIDFIDEFIEAMKRHVPIWKVPVWNHSE